MEGTGEAIEKWEVDEMMNDGDKNQDGMLDYEGDISLTYSALHLALVTIFDGLLYVKLYK